jgi:uncharacterized membrane protein YgdD (TMEM256/DUF423 family)
MNATNWVRIGAILGGLGVILGAFGAHGLREYLDSRARDVYETAVKYQMYHALAILAVGLLKMHGRDGISLCVAGWSFLFGTLIFSGTLYGLSISGIRWLGMITPFGGGALIVGWFALAIAAGSATKATGAEL